MPVAHDITFGFQAAPSSDVPKPDHVLYGEVIEDCRLGYELGFEAAWMLEHHFSDYFPTPSPLLFMAHVARELPDLGLGTSVLVLPWYHPIRLAEEISMLNTLTRGTLHLGIGRGTAKSEYDAFGVDMREARARFAEVLDIVRTALRGEPFTYRGSFYDIPNPITIRPQPIEKEVKFYGAIGSPASGAIMAELGVPPICLSTFPDGLLTKILDTWRAGVADRSIAENATLPISVKLMIADTDEKAFEMGRRYYPPYFALQADHYEVDADPWADIEGYQAFSRMFANLRKLADPNEVGPFMNANLVGSPETISNRIEALTALGFNYFMCSAATPGTPHEVRQEVMSRFAKEVAPKYSARFRTKYGTTVA
jgi:alkanesulfonate monooxygenase SsuD/methylene tetrahydromethanopterin reductase-like flavin-dependent oxidoreductase (luciferase family)